jgi:hypothetical protein
VHSPALHHLQRLAVHLHPHLVTVHLLEVLRVVDTEVPHPEGVALVVEEEAVHHREVHQGGDGEARATARTAVIARVGAEAGVDL